MICNKHIEIHMELVSKIQKLKNGYEELEKTFTNLIGEAVAEKDNDKFIENKTSWLMINGAIKDLEELLK